jgi:hypothetical protein
MKFIKKTVFAGDYDDLETLVQEVYGIDDYSFTDVQECSNDSTHTFVVEKVTEQFYKADAKLIRSGKRVPRHRNGLLLNCLCADGHIEPGEYIIDVCW